MNDQIQDLDMDRFPDQIMHVLAGGAVTVRLGQTETSVVLDVTDTGLGIPHDKLERIFDRFYQFAPPVGQNAACFFANTLVMWFSTSSSR